MNSYQISGYSVQFPHAAYGTQLGFMNKVLQALTAQQNALLEAPTGSGKTLSLLCSVLSWQRKLKAEGYACCTQGACSFPARQLRQDLGRAVTILLYSIVE